MKLIVGLGNPGRKYADTRHNVGFRVIDELSRRWQIDVGRHRFSGLLGEGLVGQERVALLKPMTYMNRSGAAVREAMGFWKLPLSDLLVVVDDLALPLGRVRVRASGSAGGHNGLISVIEALGDDGFARLRIGIEWVSGAEAVDHVLGAFSAEEARRMEEVVPRAADAVACWLASGVEAAMTRFNRSDEPSDGPSDSA